MICSNQRQQRRLFGRGGEFALRGWLSSGLAIAVALALLARTGALAADPPDAPGIVSRIERRPVESRALLAVGYSRRLRALEVEFKRGGTYRYLDVPRTVYEGLVSADSKAGYYNRHVRGKYRSVYVRPRRKR